MKSDAAKPMIALKRRRVGARGQKKGSVTTKPTEIDEIIQETYGEIYKGNVANPRRMTKRYMKEYNKYIHKAQQATIEPITGEDLDETSIKAKEIAVGPDQWAPADLKLLSPKAFEALVVLLKLIEDGAEWSKQMNTATAAFLKGTRKGQEARRREASPQNQRR